VEQAIFGFLGVVVGAGISLIGTYGQTRAAERARRSERDEQRANAIESFQIETLLELQVALQREGRAQGRAHHADLVHHRNTGEPWGKQLLGEKLNNDLLVAATAVTLLTSRVRSDTVRAASEAAHEAANACSSRSESEAEDRFAAFQRHLAAAQVAIGEALRELPPPAVYRPIVTTPFLRSESTSSAV
jgi:hypothetical protein